MNAPATMRVKSADVASQGPFVIINTRDFDPAVHEPYDEQAQPAVETMPAEPPKRRGRPPKTPHQE